MKRSYLVLMWPDRAIFHKISVATLIFIWSPLRLVWWVSTLGVTISNIGKGWYCTLTGQGLPAHHNMFGGNLVPSCLDLFDIWQSQQFFVCSVLSGWSTVNCGVGRKLPAPQHPATSAPTPPSQPSIQDLSHNPILPCFISSSPIVVFPQSPLLYLFRWLLCSSATVFVFVQPLPNF